MKSFAAILALVPLFVAADHQFTLNNRCSNAINAVVADTRCGYSPRCDDASSYTGPQPGSIAGGTSKTVTIPSNWVGRIFAQNGACGEKGESCTVTEFNTDSGDQFTPQSYDISNIQGFTQSVSVSADGCETVTCTDVNCGCTNAYPPGDISGCGNDSPVRACGAGNVGFTGCDDAASYTGPQLGFISGGTGKTVTVPSKWIGRIFAHNGACGAKGENCTVIEYDLDSANPFVPQNLRHLEL
ncbi:hypothetical protein AAF712_013470 [Marasmius tenuissimus]|uniref:Thaumatin-like protein n=1 Tax=Marasmius tenuissimus TaxID=585030 RepID=A0ABR2ZEM4_9AGAR